MPRASDEMRNWVAGVAGEAAGMAKRAAGELVAQPGLVLEGERQQLGGRRRRAGSRSGDHVRGWKLDRTQRDALLQRFPPRHAFAVADHVTLQAKVAPDSAPPPQCQAQIVGRVDDGTGVEAMVVAIDGSTERPDGGTWHVTWSRGPGRKARESNDVIARLGWRPLAEPVSLELQPAVFR